MRGNEQKILTAGFILLSIILIFMSIFLYGRKQQSSKVLAEMEIEFEQINGQTQTVQANLDTLLSQQKDLLNQIKVLEIEFEKIEQTTVVPKMELLNEDIKYAYLTFDDGPSDNTIKILNFLKANNLKATFFVLEKKGKEDIYKRIVNEGHTLAVHSSTHEYEDIYKSVDAFLVDINKLKNFIKETTGYDANILRFPGGSNNTISHKYGGNDIMSRIIPAVQQEGYVYFDWNVDSSDASKGIQDTQIIIDTVLKQCKHEQTPVILMHDSPAKTTTVEALPAIVEGLKQQGFVFKNLTFQTPPVQF
ncbi:hypothetical protein AN639_01740 [Candidatus Epulonipiscium fishelsonii]|uniref:Uncharacterized protein n=1 Tax=Candidatus Epulonipiscium fishelsonii TaxID=77094 RepID=A0ACC8XED9_9FIRM|nr:hypothetical protein AN639_01740 [Epulopiscium sp. SCG-B05WGA-EpuloA1]ONI41224.1 hypothetical protein AN396_03820 [Epulopiscium sp. SCG-B11WGA-EpuloA1]